MQSRTRNPTAFHQAIVAEVLSTSTCAAFVSTPSIFFSLPDGALKCSSKVLDVRAARRS